MAALANPTVEYVGSVEYGLVTAWPANTVVAAGTLTRQNTAPTLGNERVFVCIIAGTTGATEPTWVVTNGAKTTDNTVTWQEITGAPSLNGDTVNAAVWGASLSAALGQIIYDAASGSVQVITTAGTTKSGAQPTFSATAGVTTTDNTATWTSLGLASNFGAWAAPHKRILNADATGWSVPGGTVYISNTSAETQSTAFSFSGGLGTTAKPNKYLSVSSAVAPPTSLTAGASITSNVTSGTNAITGVGYYNGITFAIAGATGSALLAIGLASGYSLTLENCTVQNSSASNNSVISLGLAAGGNALLLNPTFLVNTTSQVINITAGAFTIVGGSFFATGAVPSLAGFALSNSTAIIKIRDCDLSQITTKLVNGGGNFGGVFSIENCKLASGVTIATSGTNQSGVIRIHNCDSGSEQYRFYEINCLATIQSETTIVDNTNPASDGTTQISWNVATTASASFATPYISGEIAQWNDLTSGSHTATIQINSNVALTNADIWMELEYLGSALTPIGTSVTSRASDVLATPTAYTTSADSWGGSETSQQQMSVTFTPAMKGPIKARIYVATPNLTVYVNPLIIVS